eukprot:2161374-Alexandrium_andersonii.AAC.1
MCIRDRVVTIQGHVATPAACQSPPRATTRPNYLNGGASGPSEPASRPASCCAQGCLNTTRWDGSVRPLWVCG